jgi:hypothetical protein
LIIIAEKKDAVKVVKKDGKLQHQLIPSSQGETNLNRKKKSKWKKKK